MLKFNEKTHTYTYEGKKLKSVTTWIGELFPFDVKAISKRVAKFRRLKGELNSKGKPINAYDIRREWKESAEFGTVVHNAIEKGLLCVAGQTYDMPNIRVKHAIDWYENWERENNVLFTSPEKMIFNTDIGLAGTADIVVLHDNNNDEISIIDWKTNKKEVSFKRALKKYTLQLSTYGYMMELQGYPVKELIVVHLSDTQATPVTLKYEKDKIIEMLKGNMNE